jgi:hypothetical protein
MSTDQPEGTQDSRPDGNANFAKDAQGRTVFYPSGPAWSGYVVTDPDRERALRDVIRRRNDSRWPYLGWVLWLPFLYGFCLLFASHLFQALAVLFLIPGLLLFVFGWLRNHWWNRALFAGLEPAAPDHAISRRLRVIGATATAIATLIWLILHLYQQRISAIPAHGTIAEFFPDISMQILGTLFFGSLALTLPFTWQKGVERSGEVRAVIGALFVVLFTFGSFAWAWSIFFSPEPRVILTEAALSCDGWRLAWSDIAGVTVSYGRYGREYARLDLDSPLSDPGLTPLFLQNGHAKRCQITGLNADSEAVLDVIRDTWWAEAKDRKVAATQEKPPPIPAERMPELVVTDGGTPFKEAAAPGPISIGQRPAQVVAELGTPFTVASGSGETFYYILPHEQISFPLPARPGERRVIAVHFGRDGRVSRVDNYGLRDGKITDDDGRLRSSDNTDLPILFSMGFWPEPAPR